MMTDVNDNVKIASTLTELETNSPNKFDKAIYSEYSKKPGELPKGFSPDLIAIEQTIHPNLFKDFGVQYNQVIEALKSNYKQKAIHATDETLIQGHDDKKFALIQKKEANLLSRLADTLAEEPNHARKDIDMLMDKFAETLENAAKEYKVALEEGRSRNCDNTNLSRENKFAKKVMQYTPPDITFN